MSARPTVSIVLATHNRRDVVLSTLDRLAECGLDHRDYETIVVDNASTDGAAEAVAARRGVKLVRIERNHGSCAKAWGVDRAAAPLILFLDDDSSPRPGCLELMIRRFETRRNLAAAGFTAHLPDGSQECSALPHVFVGCGVGFRTRALRDVGGLDRTFFMAAEEYDLAFRLLAAGAEVDVFGDLEVDHLKSPTARRSERLTYLDVRNNLRVIGRYLPKEFADVYAADWVRRYDWLARQVGQRDAFRRGLKRGWRIATRERRSFSRWRLPPTVLEQVFSWRFVAQRMDELAAAGAKRILLADLGKNIYAFVRGAELAGLEIAAIADDRFAAPRRHYRRIPIIPTDDALAGEFDAVVVSNTSYVHAAQREAALRAMQRRPVANWFPPPVAVSFARDTVPA